MKRLILLTIILISAIHSINAQNESSREITFLFTADKNFVFSTKSGNSYNLLKLSELIKANRQAIEQGKILIYMDAYCGSAKTEKKRNSGALTMNENLISEIIKRDKLELENFNLNSFAHYYNNSQEDIVRIYFDAPSFNRSNDDQQPLFTSSPITPTPSPAKSKGMTFIEYSQLLVNVVRSFPSKANVGVNVGLPFYWGDMASIAADKTYLGFSIGLQGGYNFTPYIGVGLSIDFAKGKAGSKGYAEDYFLERNGMTYYSQQPDALPYADLYSKISSTNIGISCDLNVIGFFNPTGKIKGFSAVLSPTIYGQTFKANIFKKDDNIKFSNGATKPKGLSFGLGGSISLRYKVWNNVDVQFKNSIIWITNNKFDGIVTPFDKSKQNAMWIPQIGAIWNF